VGPANAPLSPVGTIEVDIILPALGATHAGSVDGNKGLVVKLEPHVDTVASCPRDLAYDHPLGLRQGIDEGALPHIPPSDDRHLHDRLFARVIPLGSRLGQLGDDLVEQHSAVAVLHGANLQWLAETE